jgi:protein MpaA
MRPRAAAAALVVLGAALAVRASAQGPPPTPAPAPRIERLGRSVEGRPIAVVRIGDRAAARKVLVVGTVHGDEPAGRAVVDVLRRRAAPRGVELLLVRDLNPDGLRRHTRQNARGVDLNRNSSQGRRSLGGPGSRFYAGPRPFSEPETRAIRALILRERPALTIWYHQPYGLVDPPRPGGDALARRYGRLTGLSVRPLRPIPGGLPRWQNVRVRRGSAFVVELRAGPLSAAGRRRHAAAVLALASAGPPGAGR